MADIESNIDLNIDTSSAQASIRSLQRQISAFQQSMARGSAANAAAASNLQTNLINNINASGKFAASIKNVTSTTESFTNSLQKNKFSMGEYFRYAGGASKSFGRLFKSEFDTINKVARENVKTLQTQYIKLGRDANGAIQSIAVRPLALDMENLATKTAIAAQRQALMNQLLKQGSTNLLNFGKNTQWAGRQLMVGFTIPLVMVGTTAAQTFMKMEEQAIRFKRVYGEMFTTTEQTNKALDEIRQLANEFTKYGVAVEKTIELAADAAAMGKMGADLTAQVAEATRLAVLGGVEQQQALEATISLTNAFGVSADQLTGKINFLNAVENQTVTSIEDLTIAIPKAGPVVQQLGGNVEDLTFFLTAMREGGINASEGANALKSGLAALINPTGKASEMLQSLGINITGIVEANKGDVKGVVVDFAKALDTLDPLNRARAIEQLFGKFQFSRLSTLFQNVIAQGSQANKVLTLSRATTEELAILSERELKRVSDSPMFKFQKAVEDLKVSLVPLGEAFLKAVTPIVEFVKGILDRFNQLDEGAKSFIVGLTAVLGGIGPIAIMAFGLLANGVAQIIKGFVAVKSIFNGTGNQSQILAEQTNYLTTQQLEAAAVAASLDQSHMRLTQTFTSEKTALQLLITEYQRAMAAQAAIRPMTTGQPGVRPRKFASGGMVPGSGAGDTVPAMLTPGEFVVNKQATNVALPMLQALNSGKLPGFADGGLVGKSYNLNVSTAAIDQAILKKIEESLRAAEAVGDSVFQGLSQSIEKLGTITQGKINDLLSKPEFQLLSSSTASKGGRSTGSQGMVKAHGSLPVGVSAADVSPFITGNQASKLQNASKINAYNNLTFGMPAAFNRGQLTGSEGAAFVSSNKTDFMSQIVGQSKLDPNTPELNAFAENVADQMAKAGSKVIGDGEFAQIISNAISQEIDTVSKQVSAEVKQTFAEARKVGTLQYTVPGQDGKAVTNRMNVPMSGRGLSANGLQTIGSGTAPYRTVNLPAGAHLRADAYIHQVIRDRFAGIETTIVDAIKAETKQASPSKKAYDAGRNIGVGAINGIRSTEKQAVTAGQELGMATVAGTEASATGTPVGPRHRAGGRHRAVVTKKPRRPITSRGMGGAGMIASTALMGASMAPGAIGEAAQSLSMPLMMVSSALSMLPAPIALAVIGIGGLAAIIFGLNAKFSDAQKKTMQLTESLGASEKALNGLAEAAGNVGAGEIMDKRRKEQYGVFQIQTGKTTFGQSYMQSEQGQGLLQSATSAVETGGRAQAQSQILNQLATAVASDRITTAQARSIVANLSEQMGDYAFGIQLNGQLTKLLGPNGENLEKDPLGVRMAIIGDTEKQFKGVSSTLTNNINLGVANGLDQGALVGSAAASGAILGGIIGTAIGTPIVGAIGAGIGAAIGGITAYVSTAQDFEKLAVASGASVAMGQIMIQQQQEMSDALELDYERRIAAAQAAGETAKADQLINDRLRDREKIQANNIAIAKNIQQSYGQADKTVKNALMTGAKSAVEATYKDSPMLEVAKLASAEIASSGQSGKIQYQLQMELASKSIDPMQMLNILQMKDQETKTQMINIIGNYGGAFANQVSSLTSLFVDKDGKPIQEIQSKLVAAIDAAPTDKEAQKILDFYFAVSQSGAVLDTAMTVDFLLKNPGKAKQLMENIDEIKALKGPITMEVLTKILGKQELDALNKDLTYFNGLDDNQKKVYLQTLTTTISTVSAGDPQLQNWLNAEGAAFKNAYPATQINEYAAWNARQVSAISVDTTGQEENKPKPIGGGAKKEDPYKDILKSLQNVRNAAINAAGGAKELLRILGKGKDIKQFAGIGQQLIGKGVSNEFADYIMNADKATQKLFITIKNGKVVLTALGKAMKQAYDEKILGDFQLAQKRSIKDVSNQINAFGKLRAAGMQLADAGKMVENAELAGAIARAKSAKEIKELINDYYRLKEAQEKLLMLTPEGMQSVFDEGFNMAMDAFNAREEEINIKFKITNAADLAQITADEDSIAKINYQIDDLDAQLQGIADQEDEINKKYDEKVEALDKVKRLNQDILNQQKAQLSIADALTSGDIAGATKAIQDARAQNAGAALDAQGNMLDLARQGELDAVRSKNGKSRVQIEKQIKDLKQRIFEIEESSLEPARERLRIAELQRDKDIQSLTVAGHTKDEWLKIKNNTDLAKTSSDTYRAAIQKSLDIADNLVNKWKELNKTYTTTHIINTINSTSGANAGGTGDGTISDGTPTDTVKKINPLYTAAKTELDKISKQLTDAQATLKNYSGYLKAYKEVKASSPEWGYLYDDEIAKYAKLVSQWSSTVSWTGKAVQDAKTRLSAIPQYLSKGGQPKARGTDTVPAMLTPGEFVMSRGAVANFGLKNMEMLNSGNISMGGMSLPAPAQPTFSVPGNSQMSGISMGGAGSSSNSLSSVDNSVYNYNLSVKVEGSNADPNDIANTVMRKIQSMQGQGIKRQAIR